MQPLSCLGKFLGFYFICFLVFNCICIHEVAWGFCDCLSTALTSIGHKQQRQFSTLNIIFNQSVQQSNILVSVRKQFLLNTELLLLNWKRHSDWKLTAFWSSERKHSQCLWFWFALSSSQRQKNLNKAFVKNKTHIHMYTCVKHIYTCTTHVVCTCESTPSTPILEILH